MTMQTDPQATLAPPVMPPQKKSRLWIVILVLFLLVMLGGFALIALIFAGAVATVTHQGAAAGSYREKTILGTDSMNKVAVISLTGSIGGWGNALQGEGMAHDLTAQLRIARQDLSVRTVLLHIDTPGGSVTASDTIYNAVLQLQKSGKKVVVCVDDLCASGGYYVSAPADYIVCHPTGMVGSFGVIMFRFELEGLLQKLGIKFAPVKSTSSKDIGSPFRPLTPEEREYFKEILVKMHQRFVGIIAKGRKLDKEKVEKLATGKIYLADDALNYGLIDEIGYFDAAIEKCREFAGTQNAQFIEYQKPPSLLQQLGMKANYSGQSLDSMLNEAARYKIKALMQNQAEIK